MRSDRVLATIDFHTAGIGMRLLTSGLGHLPGATIADKRRWFQEHLDHLRTGLCLEPRGHRGMLIAVMTEPVTPGAQFGLFFIDTEAGAVETIARSEGDRVRAVTLKWTPSFVALPDQVVEVEGIGEVPLDIAVGVGNVFAVVQAEHVGVAVRREQVRRIAQASCRER